MKQVAFLLKNLFDYNTGENTKCCLLIKSNKKSKECENLFDYNTKQRICLIIIQERIQSVVY